MGSQCMSERGIAKNLGLNRKVVHRVLRDKDHHDICVTQPKRSRPKKFDDRLRRRVCLILLRGEATTAVGVHRILTTSDKIQISSKTVRNILHEGGFYVKTKTKKPVLTAEHKKRRLQFAKDHVNWTVEQWKSVMFSDETIITSCCLDSRQLVWTKNTDPLDTKTILEVPQGGGPRIMLWSCITWDGMHDLVNLEGKVNAIRYTETLQEYMLPVKQKYFQGKPFIFQQDNATIHNAQVTKDFFKSEKITVLDWPPHSPDLNIIEHVWRYLKVKLYKLPVATNVKELWEKINSLSEEMWDEKMTEAIQALYESIPRRMAAVIKAKGGHTKY